MFKYLQSVDIHIKSSSNLCKATINKIKQLRKKESFEAFWKEASEFAISNDVDMPLLPRKRSVPSKHTGHLPAIINFKTVEEKFESHYYELIDAVLYELNRRFDDKKMYAILAIFNLINEESVCESCIEYNFKKLDAYKEHISFKNLRNELNLWYEYKKRKSLRFSSFKDLIENFSKFNLKNIFPELFILIKIYLSIPISSATGERSFSALRRIKTWLRNTCGQERLSDLALLHIESEELDSINIDQAVDMFAKLSDRRMDFY